jgi:hypothetical protein
MRVTRRPEKENFAVAPALDDSSTVRPDQHVHWWDLQPAL